MRSSPFQYLSPGDWARLSAVNAQWNDDIVAHRKTVIDLFTPLLRNADKAGIAVDRDIAYGPDERHRLDIFTHGTREQCPVLVFVHGGAFTRGAKSVDGEIYDNVPLWFARQGFVGVNVEYRLAPAAPYPSGAEDVGRAIEWIAQNIAAYGGNADRIVLMGHSAGGAHVATYLLDPNVAMTPHASIAAAVLVSARLWLDVLPDNPNAKNVAAYCGGETPDLLARCSPLSYADRCRWPMLIAFAEHENRYLDQYSCEFAARLAARQKKMPRLIQMAGHNHTSIVAHFNAGEEWLGREIVDFVREAPC